MSKPSKAAPKEHVAAINAGRTILAAHPLFSRLDDMSPAWRDLDPPFDDDGFARLVVQGRRRFATYRRIELNVFQRLEPAEWAHVMAQAAVHFVFCHDDPAHQGVDHWVACAIVATEFLEAIGVGRRPEALSVAEPAQLGRDLETIRRNLRQAGPELINRYAVLGLNGPAKSPFLHEVGAAPLEPKEIRRRKDVLATAIRASIVTAIDEAGVKARGPATAKRNPNSLAERARGWFVANFPLLAALAAGFDIVENADTCAMLEIAVAAIDGDLGRIYINPKFPWTYEKMKFVMAHELLHVGLRHEPRRQGRDPYLWNVACDYVINGWLVTMGVGEIATDCLLLDPELRFERDSAEAIYDRIVADLRLMRRMAKVPTLRGRNAVDMISNRPPAWWNGPGTDLDAFYRRALAQGLDLHLVGEGRGLLPGDLVEEIRALEQKPIAWDVRMGQWLDAFFPPLGATRSFARASRRQAATPDIPRPVWIIPRELVASRTFGVVLDTSGSMAPGLLARGLGAIAAYALSREVPKVRVLQCDAGVHDMGYVAPEELLGRVEVKGRGGTILAPAIDRLQHDDGFPKDAPILVITDGRIDQLSIKREHAWLMPEGARLPFPSSAPRFAFEKA